MKRTLLPSISDFFFILLFISALMTGPAMLNIDGDLPRHLLMGKVVLATGAAPTQEIFSYVYENQPYTPHEWLADVIYYAVYFIAGLNGVVLLASALIAATFGLLYAEAAAQNGKAVLTFLLMLLGAAVTSIHWVTRPHLFTMLFLAVWTVLLDRRFRGHSIKVWIFPILMLFWANMHAEFIAGFLVLAAYIAGYLLHRFFRRSQSVAPLGKDLFGIALFSFLASMINPVGLRTWDVVVGYINNRYLLARITETRPPDFTEGAHLPLLILLGISVLLMITRRDKIALPHYFLLVGFGIMSLLSARNAHLSGVVFPFVLSLALTGATGVKPLARIESVIGQMESQAKGVRWPVVIVVIGALLLLGPMGRFNRYDPAVFPVEAVRWLETHPQSGRMFNAFDWGGYILFYLWPEQKVFIESQTDVRGEVTRKYETVILLQDGWQAVFEQYEISWAILPPDWHLTRELQKQGWKPVYEDQTAIILIMR